MGKENYKLLAHAEDVGGKGHSGEGSFRSRPDGSTYNYVVGIIDLQTEKERYLVALGLDSQDMSWGSALVYTDDLHQAVELFNEVNQSYAPAPLTVLKEVGFEPLIADLEKELGLWATDGADLTAQEHHKELLMVKSVLDYLGIEGSYGRDSVLKLREQLDHLNELYQTLQYPESLPDFDDVQYLMAELSVISTDEREFWETEGVFDPFDQEQYEAEHPAETKTAQSKQPKENTMEQTAPVTADKKEAHNLSLQLNTLKDQSKPTKAMASVAIDGAFAINNITLVQNKDGKMFASFPKQKQGEQWRDIVQFAQDENGKMTKEAQALKKQINDTLVEMYDNNEKSRTAAELTPTAYEVSARVNLLRGSESATKALATVRIGDLVEINPVRINESSQTNQPFVAMPSAKDKRSESGYRDIVHPINKAMRETISQVTLGKYADQQQWGKHNDRKAEKAKTQEPQTKDTQAKKKDAHEI